MAITKTGAQIALDSNFTNPTTFEQNGRVTSINVSNLSPSTRYYVRGYVIDNGTTIYSQNLRSFDTVTPDYLTFTNTSGSQAQVSLIKYGSPTDIELEYSTDGSTWSSWQSANGDFEVTLEDSEFVMFRGTNSTFSEAEYDYYYFGTTELCEVRGNIMTLVDEFGMLGTIPCDYCFCKLFLDCANIENDGIYLPADTLTDYCYMYMFKGCSYMSRCPDLPADTLTEGCYWGTFTDCVTIPESPDLVAQYLAPYSYYELFKGCYNLSQIMCHAEEWDASYAQDWVEDVAPVGIIYLSTNIVVGPGANEIPQDDRSGCPVDWTIEQSI